jgi:hypothetical protein
MNVYMLYYLFLRHRNDMKIDICDPINLFGLAAASTFSHFPESSLILSPEKESERPLSTEWKIRSDEGGKMEIAQVSPIVDSDGRSPNDTARSTGFTPLLMGSGWDRGKKNGAEESVEMV